MTLLRVAPEKTSLPVADDVTLGNHGDSGLDGFLQWAAISLSLIHILAATTSIDDKYGAEPMMPETPDPEPVQQAQPPRKASQVKTYAVSYTHLVLRTRRASLTNSVRPPTAVIRWISRAASPSRTPAQGRELK